MAGQTIINLGTGGAVLNGQSGSTTGADTNDPLFLDWPGANGGSYLYIPAANDCFASVPDAANLRITGDLDLRWYGALDDYSVGAITQHLVSKLVTAGQYNYRMYASTAGFLILDWSTNGTAIVTATSTVSIASAGVADGASIWLRATLDVDNGAAGYDAKFYTSTDGTTWTQLGATVTGVGVTSIFAGTSGVAIGNRLAGATNQYAAGKHYRAQILSGIAGTTVLDVDFSLMTSGSAATFTARTGQTVTIASRPATGAKTVQVVSPVWLFADDDYISIADSPLLDFGASESFTIVLIARLWGVDQMTVIAKKAGYTTAAGWMIYRAGSTSYYADIADGTNRTNPARAYSTAGTLDTAAAVRDVTADTIAMNVNGGSTSTADATTGSLANALLAYIGRQSTGTEYADMELVAAAVFRRALSATELAAIKSYYDARLS